MKHEQKDGGYRITFSLRLKIILTFFIISSLVGVSLSYFTYRILERSLFQELQMRVHNLTQVGSHLIDREALKRLIVRCRRRSTTGMWTGWNIRRTSESCPSS